MPLNLKAFKVNNHFILVNEFPTIDGFSIQSGRFLNDDDKQPSYFSAAFQITIGKKHSSTLTEHSQQLFKHLLKDKQRLLYFIVCPDENFNNWKKQTSSKFSCKTECPKSSEKMCSTCQHINEAVEKYILSVDNYINPRQQNLNATKKENEI